MVRILVVQTAFLGDVILITPLLRALKDIFPQASIDVLVRPQNAPALCNNPYLNEFIFFDKKHGKWKEIGKLHKLLRKNRYDIAVTPHSSLTTALLLYFAGIKRRIGFDRYWARYFLTDKFPHPKNVHKSVKNLELLQAFTSQKFAPTTEIFPAKEDKLLATRLVISRNTVALAPGSVWVTKRWSSEYYIELAKLLQSAGYHVLFTGGEEERELCAEILEKSGVSGLNCAGKLSITQSAAVFQKCLLLVCNDSGALHIANAVDTPVYAFFGPTVKTLGYYPYRTRDFVFEVDLKCRPCGSHGGKNCPLQHHNCMRNILPQEVFTKIKEEFPLEED